MWIKSAGCGGAAHQLADLYPCLIIWPNISSYNQAPGPSPPVQMNEWGVGALDNVWAQHACTRTFGSLANMRTLTYDSLANMRTYHT